MQISVRAQQIISGVVVAFVYSAIIAARYFYVQNSISLEYTLLYWGTIIFTASALLYAYFKKDSVVYAITVISFFLLMPFFLQYPLELYTNFSMILVCGAYIIGLSLRSIFTYATFTFFMGTMFGVPAVVTDYISPVLMILLIFLFFHLMTLYFLLSRKPKERQWFEPLLLAVTGVILWILFCFTIERDLLDYIFAQENRLTKLLLAAKLEMLLAVFALCITSLLFVIEYVICVAYLTHDTESKRTIAYLSLFFPALLVINIGYLWILYYDHKIHSARLAKKLELTAHKIGEKIESLAP